MWDSNNYINTWLRSHRCASDTLIRTARQKSTVSQKVYKQEDRSNVEIRVGECSLYQTIKCCLPLYLVWEFFSNFWHFPTCFCRFSPADTADKRHVE